MDTKSELRESAKILLNLTDEMAANEKEIAHAREKQESLKRQIEAVKMKLMERVGGNIRDRRIVLDGFLVHVEFQKGVSVHPVES